MAEVTITISDTEEGMKLEVSKNMPEIIKRMNDGGEHTIAELFAALTWSRVAETGQRMNAVAKALAAGGDAPEEEHNCDKCDAQDDCEIRNRTLH